MNIPILDEIMAALDGVTKEDVERATRNLEPTRKGEKKIGEIGEASQSRAVFALCEKYRGQSTHLEARAAYNANSADEKKALELESERQDTLSSLTKDIFWAQVRDEIGSDAHCESAIGIRANFSIVRLPPSRENPFLQIFEGRLPNNPME